ncbi:hypothetical protein AwWohl_05800 [Gammaproteobacteria bacterium]|nr:hypothetical protein AwWohl_05800 [Gammaproteobacteria bacterium]
MIAKLAILFLIMIVFFALLPILRLGRQYFLKITQTQTLNNAPYVDQVNSYNYRCLPGLFTPLELHFFSNLEDAVQGLPVNIFAKIRLANLIKVDKKNISNNSIIDPKILDNLVDYVLVDNQSSKPLLVIQLNDNSGDINHHQLRNQALQDLLYKADLPVLYIPFQEQYKPAPLRQLITQMLKL